MRKFLPLSPSFLSQRGFSLLQMFIALAIGLIILAGILQIFLQSKRSYNLGSAFNELQENNRFLNLYLTRVIRLAGYRSLPAVMQPFIVMNSAFPATTPYITGTRGTGPNGSDTLTIRYQGSGNGAGSPDGTVLDCLNSPVDANTIVTNIFSLTANNELQCQAINPNAANPNNTQVLVSGVENFKVLLGEDTTQNEDADRYLPPNSAFLNLNNIVSVRLSFLLRSSQGVRPYPQSNTYYLLGTTYTTPSDTILRTQMTFTIPLPNLARHPF